MAKLESKTKPVIPKKKDESILVPALIIIISVGIAFFLNLLRDNEIRPHIFNYFGIKTDFPHEVQQNSDVVIPVGANAEGKPMEATKDCVDRYIDECKTFSKNGDCINYPGWMTIHCPKSCNNCHLRDPAVRCSHQALNVSADPVYADGEMTRMFESLVDRFSSIYDVKVHSTDPYVVTFENFVSDSEAAALISTVKKWERSTDAGQVNDFGEQGRILSHGRTSSNAWCNSECDSVSLIRIYSIQYKLIV